MKLTKEDVFVSKVLPPLLIFHRIISGGVNCIHYQQGTKVLFSSMFIPELRGFAGNDNSSVFRPSVAASVSAARTINGPAVKPRSHDANSSSCSWAALLRTIDTEDRCNGRGCLEGRKKERRKRTNPIDLSLLCH